MNVTIIPVGFLGTNCYVLESAAGSCAIIDPGAQPDKIGDSVDKKKLNVRYILLTHAHHDHIGGVKALMKRYPDATLHIGQGDLEMLTDPEKSYGAGEADRDKYHIEAAQALSDGAELELDEITVRVMETPGHTRGGVCYLCGDIMFSGDTLFLNDVGRCDLYGGDYGVMKQSLAKLAALDGDYTVYPGHGESTTLDYERHNNIYINE